MAFPLGFRFRLEDYRALDECFDRIVSVGMFEHVGLKDYETYFNVVRRSLKDDGVALLHSIGRMGWAERHESLVRQIHLSRQLRPVSG